MRRKVSELAETIQHCFGMDGNDISRLKHQAQIAKWTELIEECRSNDYRLKRGASRPKLHRALIIDGSGTCWQVTKRIGFRRSAGAENGEPKRFSTFCINRPYSGACTDFSDILPEK